MVDIFVAVPQCALGSLNLVASWCLRATNLSLSPLGTVDDTIDVMVECLWLVLSTPLVYHSLTYRFEQRLRYVDEVAHPIFMLLATRLVNDVTMTYLYFFAPRYLSNLESHP